MTEKQEKIAGTALQLFATEGYNAVSTSRIAKEAGVSEGLIFRHFENKQGLLDAIMDSGKERIMEQIVQLEEEKEPEEVIRKAILLPFTVDEKDHLFWRLYYALKWQTEQYDFSILKPLHDQLITAFRQLDYEDPEAEAEIISILIDGTATAILLRDPDRKEKIQQHILDKYKL